MGRLVNDRRRHERFALRLAVQLSAAEQLAASRNYTQNISSGGFYFLSLPFFARLAPSFLLSLLILP